MEKAVVIVAGGTGSRMQMDVPKQFISLRGKPVIIYTIEAFQLAFIDISVIIVCHSEYLKELKTIINEHLESTNIKIIPGGATRFHSSYAGLQAVPFKQGLVAIHDAARPFVKPATIQQCFEICVQKGNAIPAIPITDTVRKIEDDQSTWVDRSVLRKIQTPQCFQFHEILEAYHIAAKHVDRQNTTDIQKNTFTDDASVLEFYGKPIFLCDGQPDNFKITTPVDLKLAEWMLSETK